MPKGISIHIGLNHVDPTRYNGWDGALSGCINDATDMKGIADKLGYASQLYTDAQATCACVVSSIGKAAQQLDGGDILLLTYSGHGGQVADVNGDEPDSLDETWVLWDRMLLDDELYNLWAQFKAGVRIFMLSDSCHSGTVLKMVLYDKLAKSEALSRQYRGTRTTAPKMRAAPRAVTQAVYERDRDLYDTAQWTTGGGRAAICASVTLISGCQDNQLSSDGDRNGLFTEKLLSVWDDGAYQGNYAAFHKAICDLMPPSQTPNLAKTGATNTAFDAEKPFTVGAAGGAATSAAPTITAPASYANGATPPTFSVNPGQGRYYAVEVTINPYYFNYSQYGSQRTENNFYASWKTPPFASSGSYPANYVLPQAVWDKLRANASGRLYYRVWASGSATAWVNAGTNTPDANAVSALSFELTASTAVAAASGVPSIDAPSSIANGSTPPRFVINPGPSRYAAVEVTTNPYYFNYAQYGSQRTRDNFFASWSAMPFLSSSSYPMSYDMPQDAWDRLRASAARLYYRIWATDSPNSWVNNVSNTPDANAVSAKSFAIARSADEATEPTEQLAEV